jgi:Na+/H+-dicarboxylate symporter
VRILAGLILGLVLGTLASLHESAPLSRVIAAIEPVGTLWIRALQMTVIPLVTALLIGSIVSAAEQGKVGRIARRAFLTFLLLYLGVAGATLAVTPTLLSWLRIAPGALGEQHAGAAAGQTGSARGYSLGEELPRLIPANPFAAAANGDILPLFIFCILFAVALTRIDAAARGTVARVFTTIADAMLMLVRWLLVVAPVGVFAVVLPLIARTGFGGIGALTSYVVLLSGLCVLFAFPLYPVATVIGRHSLLRFARATAPSQAVALSTQSSLASLPVMLDGAEKRLGSPQQVAGVVLPLAVSVFRYSTPIWLVVASLFVARVYGIDLVASEMATIAGLSVLMSVAGVGLPSGATYFGPITPVFLAVGLPVDAIAILFAVDTIPDMIETVANVTADLAVTAVVSR